MSVIRLHATGVDIGSFQSGFMLSNRCDQPVSHQLLTQAHSISCVSSELTQKLRYNIKVWRVYHFNFGLFFNNLCLKSSLLNPP